MRRPLLALAAMSLIASGAGCKLGQMPGTSSPTNTPSAAGAPSPTSNVPVTAPGAAPESAPGAAPAASPAGGESVAGFPDYPGATKTAAQSGNNTKAGIAYRETKAKFTTNDPFDRVKAYYQGLIQHGGWQIVKADERKIGEAKWTLRQGTSEMEVDLESKLGVVEISLERKDR